MNTTCKWRSPSKTALQTVAWLHHSVAVQKQMIMFKMDQNGMWCGNRQTVCPHWGVVTVGVNGRGYMSVHECTLTEKHHAHWKLLPKSSVVRCPRAFRLRRLVQISIDYLLIFPSIHPSIYQYIYSSISLCVSFSLSHTLCLLLSFCGPFHLPYLSIYLSVFRSFYLPTDLSIYGSIYLSIYLSLSLSVCLAMHRSI